MNNPVLTKQDIEEILQWQREQSPKEFFEDVIRRGIMNEKGEVLIRMPEPPPKKKTASASSPRTNGSPRRSRKKAK